ncbi:Ig-like domain-containing protein [Listeria ilorinensis]|uniref:Ig-like domain-containing protein n=1 Tax=Listeria ilorinensis TaxID=2867439 RepID=UPI001EF61E20|nr:Ig-like domain-containing protein [Listeria ilorinensis]
MDIIVSSYIGDKVLVRVFNKDGVPLAIGGQKTASWGDTADTIDVSTKTGGILNYNELMMSVGVTADQLPNKEYNNFKEYIQGQNDWKIDVDGAVPSTNEAYDDLRRAKKNGEPVFVSQIDLGRNEERLGIAIVVDVSNEASKGDTVSFKLSLQGTGEYIERPYTAPVAPTAITQTPIAVKVGETKELSITTTPADASKEFIYAIDDDTIATVNYSSGAVTGLKVGTAKLNIISKYNAAVTKEVAVAVTSA